MQETYENQLIQPTNEMVLTRIKDEQGVWTKGLLDPISPSENALPLQNNHKKRRIGCVVLPDGLAGFQGKE